MRHLSRTAHNLKNSIDRRQTTHLACWINLITWTEGRRVLELGSGTGVLGIVCAVRGAHVTITDQSQLIALMQRNADLNKHLMQRSHGSCLCQVLCNRTF